MRLYFNYFLKILFLISPFYISAQTSDKTVTLTSSGIGRTQDEAKQNALRSAIEQAFGTFISSKTEILNDELVKDEIVSVSNGNIQFFKLISEVQLPDNNWNATLNATVSVTKLASFVVSKGGKVEFNGAMMAFNLNQQKLNETNEIKAMDDMMKVVKELADNSFNFEISANDPVSVAGSADHFRIPLTINVKTNNNFTNITRIIYSTLKGLSLTRDQSDDYLKLKKFVYPVSYAASENEYGYFVLRTEESLKRLLETVYYFNKALTYFKITNGIDEFTLSQKPNGLEYIYDKYFRVLLKKYQGPRVYPESVFYMHFEVNTGYYGYNFGLAEFQGELVNYDGRKLIEVSGDYRSYHKLRILENFKIAEDQQSLIYNDDENEYIRDLEKGKYYFLNYKYWLQEFPDYNNEIAAQTFAVLEIDDIYRSTGIVPKTFHIKFPYGFKEYNYRDIPKIGYEMKKLFDYSNNFTQQFSFLSKINGYEVNCSNLNYKINGYTPFSKYDVVDNSDFDELSPEEIEKFISDIKILEAGIVISFSGIKPGTQVVRYDYNDLRTIDEINKMRGYSVQSLGNYANASPPEPQANSTDQKQTDKNDTPEKDSGFSREDKRAKKENDQSKSESTPGPNKSDVTDYGSQVNLSKDMEPSNYTEANTPSRQLENNQMGADVENDTQKTTKETYAPSNNERGVQTGSFETQPVMDEQVTTNNQTQKEVEAKNVYGNITNSQPSQSSIFDNNTNVSAPVKSTQTIESFNIELSGAEITNRTIIRKPEMSISHHKAGKVIFNICIDEDGSISDLELSIVKSTIVSEKIITKLKEFILNIVFVSSEQDYSCGAITFNIPSKESSVITPVQDSKTIPTSTENRENLSLKVKSDLPESSDTNTKSKVAGESISINNQPSEIKENTTNSKTQEDLNQKSSETDFSNKNVELQNIQSHTMKLGVLGNIDFEITGLDIIKRPITFFPEFENYTNEKCQIAFNFCLDKSGSVTFIQYDPENTQSATNKLMSIFQTKSRNIKFSPSEKDEECGLFIFNLKRIK